MEMPFIPEAVSAAAVLAVTLAFLKFIGKQNELARDRDHAFLQQLNTISERHDEREKEATQVLRELHTTVVKMNGRGH